MTIFLNTVLALFFVTSAASIVSAIFFYGARHWVSAPKLLRANYILYGSAFAVCVFTWLPTAPKRVQISPQIRAWSQNTPAAPTLVQQLPALQPVARLSDSSAQASLIAIVSLFGLALAIAFYLMLKDLWSTHRVLKSSYAFKKVGRVRILVSSAVDTPFSLWRPGAAYVVLPYSLVTNLRAMRLCVAHELQHHRQRDTVWAYVLFVTRILFFWNPLVPLWHKIIHELQEFSCDQVLTGRRNFSVREYIDCLIQVAENRLTRKVPHVCATGVAFVQGHQLKRRIEFMLSNKHHSGERLMMWSLLVFSIVSMAGIATASREVFQNRTVNRQQLRTLLESSGFTNLTVAAEDEVHSELTRVMTSEDRRKFFRGALERFHTHESTVMNYARTYGVPREVALISLFESGFQNLPPRKDKFFGSAGIWQFIASTAEAFGLNVIPGSDERLDLEKSTRAAMRYLTMNRARFDSWDLSILAYNCGENAVEDALDKTNSRDPWIVKKVLPEETQRYYPKYIVANLIAAHPNLVAE